MNIVRDDGDESRTRVDRMVEEFRTAQSRRLAKHTAAKGDDRVVEVQPDAHGPGNGRQVSSNTDFTVELE